MITQVRGRLVEKNPTEVVVDCNGVGYLLHISLNTFSALPEDENVILYTHLSIREDAHTLFGFINKTEREVFKLLISVSGVGPSIARTMCSSMTSEDNNHPGSTVLQKKQGPVGDCRVIVGVIVAQSWRETLASARGGG